METNVLLRKLISRVYNMIGIGFLSKKKDDDKNTSAYITFGSKEISKTTRTNIAQPYGIASNFPINTLLYFISPFGYQQNKISMPFVVGKRIKNIPDNTIIFYNPETEGRTKITLNSNGVIDIESDNEINIKGSQVNLGKDGSKIARVGDQVEVDGKLGIIKTGGNNTSV